MSPCRGELLVVSELKLDCFISGPRHGTIAIPEEAVDRLDALELALLSIRRLHDGRFGGGKF